MLVCEANILNTELSLVYVLLTDTIYTQYQ